MDGERRYGWWFAEDYDGDLVFCKGKHEGELLANIANDDPSYLEWLLANVDLVDQAYQVVEDAM